MILLYIVLLLHYIILTDSTVIKTDNGYLRGAEFTAPSGKTVHAFKRVPFAAPPLGSLRFAFPEPAQPWKGVWDATKYGPACMSNSSTTSSPQKWVHEDCLHVNIFVSDKCLKSGDCPVVFYIHGGGLQMDSAVMFDDDHLVRNFGENDVVLVIPAFRLGFFSLLSFDNDDVIPRNLAVYDMIHALKWIQSDIQFFGGNPGQVTLLGHSMGGSAVLALSFSKTIDPDRKLFHRAIAMSPLVVFVSDIKRRRESWEFAHRAGCSRNESQLAATVSNEYVQEVVDCLRTKDGLFLLSIQRKMAEEDSPTEGIMALEPLFEENYRDFITNPPKVPLLCGTNTKELDNSKDDYSLTLADIHGYRNPQALAAKFLKDKEEGHTEHSSMTQLFFVNVHQLSHIMRKQGADTYIYSYRNPVHPKHTDDLSYLMGVHVFEPDENEAQLAVIYPQLFINYIKTGKPNDDWKPLEADIDNYYYIDINVTSGLRPHNALHYEKETISYWTKDMKLYDKGVTLKRAGLKHDTVKAIKHSLLSPLLLSSGFSFSRIFWSILLVLGGFFIGRMSTKREKDIQAVFPNEKTHIIYH